jgi:sialate O-acetylesterase
MKRPPTMNTDMKHSRTKNTRMKHARNLFCLLALCLLPCVARADVRLPALIGDNMVLQQGRKARVWGKAAPGERVTISLAGRTARAVADAGGRWQAFVGPLKAGGPFTLTIKGANTITVNNVLVGEVWVCSGQSNMEWPLSQATGGVQAATEANYPEMRLFTVRRATSATPLDDVEGRWVVASPQTAPPFSAVGFFFGRELYRRLKVPVGLIHSSWGGTPAEAWTSTSTLASLPELKPVLERYERERNDPNLGRGYEQKMAEWERTFTRQDPGNKGEALGYAAPTFDASGWRQMNLPQLWESAGLNIDGAVWFRREVDVPASWAGRDLVLNLGPLDDFDTTYFNGTGVGATGAENPNSYTVPRSYTVPGALVRAGRNIVAVRVFDRSGGGGFAAVPGQMSLAPRDAAGDGPVKLDGPWSYKVEVEFKPIQPDYSKMPAQPPGPKNPNSPSVLYNAMLAPLTPYALRGAIWYQGEANAGRAYQYRTLFPAMIRDWRAAWGEGDFPFYFVQLADFMPAKPDPSESEWAELREAQTMALGVPHTGMAVTIDIGNPEDIHPRNKLDVGMRLARWALADTYGQKVEESGPLYRSFSVEGDKVRVRFAHAAGLRATPGGSPLRGFAVAGGDHKFVWADARIDGETVVVWSKSVPRPVAVRYDWADDPNGNLYNSEGLPASPFRTDDWPGLTAGRR